MGCGKQDVELAMVAEGTTCKCQYGEVQVSPETGVDFFQGQIYAILPHSEALWPFCQSSNSACSYKDKNSVKGRICVTETVQFMY